MQRLGTEVIGTQIQPSKAKRKITKITNSQNTKTHKANRVTNSFTKGDHYKLKFSMASFVKGAVVEWLECLTAEREIACSNPTRIRRFESHSGQNWKTLTVHPPVNGYLTIVGEGSRRRKERIGTAIHTPQPNTRWGLLRPLGYGTPLPFTFMKSLIFQKRFRDCVSSEHRALGHT